MYRLKATGTSLHSPMPAGPSGLCLVPVPRPQQFPVLVALSQPGGKEPVRSWLLHIPVSRCCLFLKCGWWLSPGAAGQPWGHQQLWRGNEKGGQSWTSVQTTAAIACTETVMSEYPHKTQQKGTAIEVGLSKARLLHALHFTWTTLGPKFFHGKKP